MQGLTDKTNEIRTTVSNQQFNIQALARTTEENILTQVRTQISDARAGVLQSAYNSATSLMSPEALTNQMKSMDGLTESLYYGLSRNVRDKVNEARTNSNAYLSDMSDYMKNQINTYSNNFQKQFTGIERQLESTSGAVEPEMVALHSTLYSALDNLNQMQNLAPIETINKAKNAIQSSMSATRFSLGNAIAGLGTKAGSYIDQMSSGVTAIADNARKGIFGEAEKVSQYGNDIATVLDTKGNELNEQQKTQLTGLKNTINESVVKIRSGAEVNVGKVTSQIEQQFQQAINNISSTGVKLDQAIATTEQELFNKYAKAKDITDYYGKQKALYETTQRSAENVAGRIAEGLQPIGGVTGGTLPAGDGGAGGIGGIPGGQQGGTGGGISSELQQPPVGYTGGAGGAAGTSFQMRYGPSTTINPADVIYPMPEYAEPALPADTVTQVSQQEMERNAIQAKIQDLTGKFAKAPSPIDQGGEIDQILTTGYSSLTGETGAYTDWESIPTELQTSIEALATSMGTTVTGLGTGLLNSITGSMGNIQSSLKGIVSSMLPNIQNISTNAYTSAYQTMQNAPAKYTESLNTLMDGVFTGFSNTLLQDAVNNARAQADRDWQATYGSSLQAIQNEERRNSIYQMGKTGVGGGAVTRTLEQNMAKKMTPLYNALLATRLNLESAIPSEEIKQYQTQQDLVIDQIGKSVGTTGLLALEKIGSNAEGLMSNFANNLTKINTEVSEGVYGADLQYLAGINKAKSDLTGGITTTASDLQRKYNALQSKTGMAIDTASAKTAKAISEYESMGGKRAQELGQEAEKYAINTAGELEREKLLQEGTIESYVDKLTWATTFAKEKSNALNELQTLINTYNAIPRGTLNLATGVTTGATTGGTPGVPGTPGGGDGGTTQDPNRTTPRQYQVVREVEGEYPSWWTTGQGVDTTGGQAGIAGQIPARGANSTLEVAKGNLTDEELAYYRDQGMTVNEIDSNGQVINANIGGGGTTGGAIAAGGTTGGGGTAHQGGGGTGGGTGGTAGQGGSTEQEIQASRLNLARQEVNNMTTQGGSWETFVSSVKAMAMQWQLQPADIIAMFPQTLQTGLTNLYSQKYPTELQQQKPTGQITGTDQEKLQKIRDEINDSGINWGTVSDQDLANYMTDFAARSGIDSRQIAYQVLPNDKQMVIPGILEGRISTTGGGTVPTTLSDVEIQREFSRKLEYANNIERNNPGNASVTEEVAKIRKEYQDWAEERLVTGQLNAAKNALKTYIGYGDKEALLRELGRAQKAALDYDARKKQQTQNKAYQDWLAQQTQAPSGVSIAPQALEEARLAGQTITPETQLDVTAPSGVSLIPSEAEKLTEAEKKKKEAEALATGLEAPPAVPNYATPKLVGT